MYSIGYDIGSSSIKAAIVDLNSGKTMGIVTHPEVEMGMTATQEGWAEQHPDQWWEAICIATQNLLAQSNIPPSEIKSIGIAYQMHGLVVVDKNYKPLRPSIIWCDSRAVDIGNQAADALGTEYCQEHLLNSPGNFTASKLRWIKENEPEVYSRIHKAMLPGDYIAMKLTGKIQTTVSGLSEGIFWDFKEHKLADKVLNNYEIAADLLPEIVETFANHGQVTQSAAEQTGLIAGTNVSYRAGDQPNNALALNVLNPGEIAATGGTSGVVYGISDQANADVQSRVNGFAHVNHSKSAPRVAQLLCINGAGSQYAWIRKQLSKENTSYVDMEKQLSEISVGSEGLRILPFGNGAERMLNNKQIGAQYNNVQFNKHSNVHFYRAALEGIAFAFIYGIKILEGVGIKPETIRVGNDNLFQSATFSKTVASLAGCNIEMIETTGAVGAAKASGYGMGYYKSINEAVSDTNTVKTYTPHTNKNEYVHAYKIWEHDLTRLLG